MIIFLLILTLATPGSLSAPATSSELVASVELAAVRLWECQQVGECTGQLFRADLSELPRVAIPAVIFGRRDGLVCPGAGLSCFRR